MPSNNERTSQARFVIQRHGLHSEADEKRLNVYFPIERKEMTIPFHKNSNDVKYFRVNELVLARNMTKGQVRRLEL